MHKHWPRRFGREDFLALREALPGNLKPSPARAFAANATGSRSLANDPRWCSFMASKDRASQDTCWDSPSAPLWPDGIPCVLINANCGGTESLTPTLYNSGLSGDFRAVLNELIERDSLPEIFFAGYSMGGNLVLKMAGELAGAAPPQLRGLAAVGPALELAQCVDAVDLPSNFVYQRHFVKGLKNRMRRKAQLFPGKFDLSRMARVRTLREFDDVITATYCGFANASDYYARSSALRIAGRNLRTDSRGD